MADTLSAYTRSSTFTAEDTSSPITAVTWYQAWDPSGNGSFAFSPIIFRDAHIEWVRRDRFDAILASARLLL